MTLSELLNLLRWDFRMNRGSSFDHLRAWMLLIEVRLEQYAYRKLQHRPGLPFRLLWGGIRFIGAVYQWFFFSSNIPGSVQIGRGLRLPHPQNITIAAQTTIGDFCVVYQDVNIIWNGFRLAVSEKPRIGDRVLIGTGAIIIGDVTVGDDVLIGAGAIVPRSVPAQSRVLNAAASVSERPVSADAPEAGSAEHLRDLYAIWR